MVWLAGLAAGFVGLLSATAHYGCSAGDHGFACHTSGSVVGWLLVAAVIAIVIAVTVLTLNRSARGVLTVGGVSLVALALCFVAARSLLATA